MARFELVKKGMVGDLLKQFTDGMARQPSRGDTSSLPDKFAQKMTAILEANRKAEERDRNVFLEKIKDFQKLSSPIEDIAKDIEDIKKRVVEAMASDRRFVEAAMSEASRNVAERRPTSKKKPSGKQVDEDGVSFDHKGMQDTSRAISRMDASGAVANDMIKQMNASLRDVTKSGRELGDVMYGHSVLPDMKEHAEQVVLVLREMKEVIEEIRDAALGMPPMFGGGMRGGPPTPPPPSGAAPGDAFNSDENREIVKGANLTDAVNLLAHQIQQLQAAIYQMSAGEKGGQYNLEDTVDADRQDRVTDAYRKSKLLGAKSVVSVLMGIQIPRAIVEIQELNKEINNATGGMLGTVDAARAYRIETTNALQDIRRSGGFTVQQLGAAAQAVLDVGVSAPEVISRSTETMLYGARALGVEANTVTQEYLMQARTLRQGNDQVKLAIAGTLRIARNTGLTARNVVDARKEMESLVSELRRAGNISLQLANNVAESQIMANKLGVGDLNQDILKASTSMDNFFSQQGEFGIILPQVMSRLTQQGVSVQELISGTLTSTVAGMRQYQKAVAEVYKGIHAQALAIDDISQRNIFIQMMTNQRIRSEAELLRNIESQVHASETATEKQERLTKAREMYNDMLSGGLNDQMKEARLMALTGDSSIKSVTDLESAIKQAEARVATDREDLAADFYNQVVQKQMEMMKFQKMAAADAEKAAFESLSGQLRGELAGLNFSEISSLAGKSFERAAKEVQDSAQAATDNMVDRIAQGVQKGIQMAINPFSDVIDAFDKLGVGPFVGAVAKFGTFALMLTTSWIGLKALMKDDVFGGMFGLGGSKGGGKGGIKGKATDLGRGVATGVTGAVKETASPAMAEDAKFWSSAANTLKPDSDAPSPAMPSSDISNASSANKLAEKSKGLVPAVDMIADAGKQLFKRIPALVGGVVAMTIIGVSIGLGVRAIGAAFPPASEVVGVAGAIAASTLVFGILVANAFALAEIGKGAKNAVKALQGMALGLASLALIGVGIGISIRLLTLAFPPADEVIGVAFAIMASVLALGAVAAATIGLFQLGIMLNGVLAGPQSAVLPMIPVVLGIIALVGVGIGLAMMALSKAFPDPSSILGVAHSIAMSAVAIIALSYATAALAVVGVMGLLLAPGILLIPPALAVITGVGVAIAMSMRALRYAFPDPDRITLVSKSIAETARAFSKLGIAFGILLGVGTTSIFAPAAKLPVVAHGIDTLNKVAKMMGEGIDELTKHVRDPERSERVAKTLRHTAQAYVEIGKAYALFATSGVLDIISRVGERIETVAPQARILTKHIPTLNSAMIEGMDTMTALGGSMAKGIAEIEKTFSDNGADVEKTARKVKVSAEAYGSLAAAGLQFAKFYKEMKDGWFIKGNLGRLNDFITDVAVQLSDNDSGIMALQTAVSSLPDMGEEKVKKIKNFTEAVGAVLSLYDSVSTIKEKYPPSSVFNRDMGDLTSTLNGVGKFFTKSQPAIGKIQNGLALVDGSFGSRARSFATGIKETGGAIGALAELDDAMSKGQVKQAQSALGKIESVVGNDTMTRIVSNIAQIPTDLAQRVGAIANAVPHLGRLLYNLRMFASTYEAGDLAEIRDVMEYVTWAMEPMRDLAAAFSIDAPAFDGFRSELANLIAILNEAQAAFPGLFEKVEELSTMMKDHGEFGMQVKTINDAFDEPGSGGTIPVGGADDSVPPGVSLSRTKSGGAATLDSAQVVDKLTQMIALMGEDLGVQKRMLQALIGGSSSGSQGPKKGRAAMQGYNNFGSTPQPPDPSWQIEGEFTGGGV